MSMIDLHTHILPGLDDGPKDLEEALAMASLAAAGGIAAVVATPHVMPGVYDNSKETILAALGGFKEQLYSRGIDLKVYPGAEYIIDPQLPLWLKQGQALTLNDGGRYLLVEFPQTGIPIFADQIIFEVQLLGVTPIIAHPERNAVFLKDPDRLQRFIERGCLCQGTGGSLTGRFGARVQQVAAQYLTGGCYHFISSDAHDTVRRPPALTEARAAAEELVGGAGNLLTSENPARVIDGLTPLPPPVKKQEKQQRGSFFARFWQKSSKTRK